MSKITEALPLRMYVPITKVDVEKRLVFGIATAEQPDRAGEICDYESTKPFFQSWSADFEKTSNGKSLGNLRAMHGSTAAGKLTSIDFDDAAKSINICAKVVDDAEWKKVEEGVYTGFSQGGRYVRRWTDEATGKTRFTAEPSEVSLVDYPCLPSATFEIVKAAGVVERIAFKSVIAEPEEAALSERAVAIAKAFGRGPQGPDFIAAHKELMAEALKKDVEQVVTGEPSDLEIAAAAEELARAQGLAAPTTEMIAQAKGALMAAAAPAEGVGDNVQPMVVGISGPDLAPILDPAKVPGADPSKTGKALETEDLVKAAFPADATATRAVIAADLLAKPDGELWTKIAKGDHGAVTSYFKAIAADEPAQLWACGCADHEHITKRGAARCKTQRAAEAAAKAATAPLAAAMADLKEGLGLNKKDYSADDRKKMAESGEAKSDGSYPIKTAKDVENAVADFGRSSGSASDKAHIIARAKAIGAESSLPDSWTKKFVEVGAMFKADAVPADKAKVHAAMANYHTANSGGDKADLHRRAAAAHAEAMIAQSAGDANAEEKSNTAFQCSRDCLGGDCGKVLAEVGGAAIVKTATTARAEAMGALKKYLGEEIWDAGAAIQALSTLTMLLSGELAEDEMAPDQLQALRDAIARVKDFIVSEIKEDNDPEMAMARAVTVLELAKKGSRNSSADQARLQKCHDLVKELGAKCDDAANGVDKAMAVKFDDLTVHNQELKKEIAAYGAQLAEMQTLMKKIDAAPVPARAALFAGAGGPAGGGYGNGGQLTPQQIQAELAKMAPEERALILTKVSLQNPVQHISERIS